MRPYITPLQTRCINPRDVFIIFLHTDRSLLCTVVNIEQRIIPVSHRISSPPITPLPQCQLCSPELYLVWSNDITIERKFTAYLWYICEPHCVHWWWAKCYAKGTFILITTLRRMCQLHKRMHLISQQNLILKRRQELFVLLSHPVFRWKQQNGNVKLTADILLMASQKFDYKSKPCVTWEKGKGAEQISNYHNEQNTSPVPNQTWRWHCHTAIGSITGDFMHVDPGIRLIISVIITGSFSGYTAKRAINQYYGHKMSYSIPW